MAKVKSKENVSESTKKKQFSKIIAYSGVKSKKSPKVRRKSLASTLSVSKNTKSSKKKLKNIVESNLLPIIPTVDKKSLLEKKTPKKKSKELNPQQVWKDTVFSEQQSRFNLKIKDVKNAVQGVVKFALENTKLKNQLFNEQIPLFLQLNCFKVPKGYSKILRIPLENSVLTPDDDICLIVPDVKGIKNIEHEKHIEHYENVLRAKGVSNIKKIMTFHEFRTEYETFELKSRLVDLYDVFLVDGRISGKVVQKCGKIFYKKRKVPIPIKLQATKLKDHVDQALKKAHLHLHLKSDSYMVQFGHNKMDNNELIANVYSIIEFLDKHFPGGFPNIRNAYVFSPWTTSIPIYISLKNPNEVEVPKLKKPKVFKAVRGELTTLLNSEVLVKPSGKVTVIRKKRKNLSDRVTDKNNVETNTVPEKTENKRKKEKVKQKLTSQTEVDSEQSLQIKKKKKRTKDSSSVHSDLKSTVKGIERETIIIKKKSSKKRKANSSGNLNTFNKKQRKSVESTNLLSRKQKKKKT